MSAKIGILLVDDHAIMRDGLRHILAEYEDFEIVGEAGDGQAAMEQYDKCRPDLVLLDLNLPRMDGAEVLRRLKKKWPRTKILVLTMHRNWKHLQTALEVGADGYCLKESPLDELVEAIRRVSRGEKFICRDMRRLEKMSSRADYADFSCGEEAVILTGREREILRLVAVGQTNGQIAAALGISEHTVDNHCTNLRLKIGVHSKRALTTYAFRSGLVA